MSFASAIEGRIAALVHPRAEGVERTRHVQFIMLHLPPSLLALAALPVRLAYGTPDAVELLGVALLQLPLVAVLLLARTGSLRLAQTVSAGGLIAVGALLAIAAPALEAAAAALFVTALFQLASALDKRFGASAILGVLAALAIIPILRDTLMLPARGEVRDPVLLGLALFPIFAYAAALAWCNARLDWLRRRRTVHEAAHHQALARAIGDLVMQIDRRGAVLTCSNDVGPLFALTPRDLGARGFYERLHLADRPAFLQAISYAFDDVATHTAVLRLRTATVRSTRGDFEEPVYSTIEMRLRRLAQTGKHHDSVNDTAVCLVRDITQQNERDLEAAAAQRVAERAEESRERFLANVSHELRTPLNAIIGFAALLDMDNVCTSEAKRKEYVGIIASSGQHLLSVVNSILDMSKIEAGSFELEAASFEPAALLDGCLDIVRLKASEAQVRIVRDYNHALAPIVGDERACRQIVINLLSNAVKFTPKGGTVTVSARSDFGLTLAVEDTGIGIAATDMSRLGDAFFQASNARSRMYEGTGLGLSLVRGLVGLHGGTIDVSSAPNKGTVVIVRLPADCRTTPASQPPVVIQTFPRAPREISVISEKVRNIA